jgi:hypothetical protein
VDLKTFLNEVKKCPDCQDTKKAVVFILDDNEKIGICEKHWSELADSDLEWGSNPVAAKNKKSK